MTMRMVTVMLLELHTKCDMAWQLSGVTFCFWKRGQCCHSRPTFWVQRSIGCHRAVTEQVHTAEPGGVSNNSLQQTRCFSCRSYNRVALSRCKPKHSIDGRSCYGWEEWKSYKQCMMLVIKKFWPALVALLLDRAKNHECLVMVMMVLLELDGKCDMAHDQLWLCCSSVNPCTSLHVWTGLVDCPDHKSNIWNQGQTNAYTDTLWTLDRSRQKCRS